MTNNRTCLQTSSVIEGSNIIPPIIIALYYFKDNIGSHIKVI